MIYFRFIRVKGSFEMAIRELSARELSFVAGGNANSNYEGGSSNHRGSAPATCANRAGLSAIIGGMRGALGGTPASVVVGAVVAGVGTAIACAPDRGSQNGGGNFGGDHNANSVNGQCHW